MSFLENGYKGNLNNGNPRIYTQVIYRWIDIYIYGDRFIDSQIDKDTDKKIEGQMEGQKDKQIDRLIDKQIYRWIQGQIDR